MIKSVMSISKGKRELVSASRFAWEGGCKLIQERGAVEIKQIIPEFQN